jgi:hypothetical protein
LNRVSKCIRLAVFTFFAAFVLFLVCEKSHAAPYIPDESGGREVGRVIYDGKGGTKYVSTVPKPRPKLRAVPKPKPKPAPKVELKTYLPKPPAPKPAPPKPYTPYNVGKVAGKTIGGGAIGAVLAPFSAGTSVVAGAGLGAAGGALWESWDWAWDNKERIASDAINQAGKIAKVEDPMGRSWPH